MVVSTASAPAGMLAPVPSTAKTEPPDAPTTALTASEAPPSAPASDTGRGDPPEFEQPASAATLATLQNPTTTVTTGFHVCIAPYEPPALQ